MALKEKKKRRPFINSASTLNKSLKTESVKSLPHTGLQNTWKNKDVCVYRKYPKLPGCCQCPGNDHRWWVLWCPCTTRYIKHPSWLKDFMHPCLYIADVFNSIIHRRIKWHINDPIKVRWKENCYSTNSSVLGKILFFTPNY